MYLALDVAPWDGYSGKCLVLPKNLAFYGKPAKNHNDVGQKVFKLWTPKSHKGAEIA